jgi:diadenosine tetraphosphatase ApaH/serine/threonine PP2A family protein phosphatase
MEYDYVLDAYSAQINFTAFSQAACFIGHSHQPVIFEEKKPTVKIIEPGELKKGGRYIINTGSVGQPRDGDPRLAFGLFDSDKFTYKLIRLDYDIESASKKIIAEGLPQRLAERLFTGT